MSVEDGDASRVGCQRCGLLVVEDDRTWGSGPRGVAQRRRRHMSGKAKQNDG